MATTGVVRECYVCLEEDHLVHAGCACRGGAGHVHVECMIKFAMASKAGYHVGWSTCNLCKHRFHGVVGAALAVAAVRHTREGSRDAKQGLAYYHYENGEYVEAKRVLVELIVDQKSMGGCALEYEGMLGDVYAACGKVALAEATMLRVIKEMATKHGPHSARTLTLEANYAGILSNAGQKQRAVDMLARIVPQLHVAFGASSDEVLYALRNLGVTLQALGELDHAKTVIQTLLERVQLIYGREHAFTKSVIAVGVQLGCTGAA